MSQEVKKNKRWFMKKGFFSLELAVVVAVGAFLYLSVWNKTRSAETDIKATIVKDDISEIFNAMAKAKVSPTVGNGTFLDVDMEDLKRWLPDSMTLVGTGSSSKVGSLSPEVGTSILYSVAHADATGSKFKLFVEADSFVSSKSMTTEKVKLLETHAEDAISERVGSYTIKDDATAIGSTASDFTTSQTGDYNGILGFGNLSI